MSKIKLGGIVPYNAVVAVKPAVEDKTLMSTNGGKFVDLKDWGFRETKASAKSGQQRLLLSIDIYKCIDLFGADEPHDILFKREMYQFVIINHAQGFKHEGAMAVMKVDRSCSPSGFENHIECEAILEKSGML